LRQNTLLEEGGVKFDLLDKALFISSAIFKQERTITTGAGRPHAYLAHIKGAEIELNYQPDPHFFATASYSYLHTTLDTPRVLQLSGAAGAQQRRRRHIPVPGESVFLPNQTFQDPGVPQHLFNVLANYKHESGFGAQANIQVTGPVETTQSGYLNMAATTSASNFPAVPYASQLRPSRPTAGTTSRPRFRGSTR
jgi:outer membrane receptor protein involved in Fe transport